AGADVPLFESVLNQHELPQLVADRIEILQINLGKLCNQVCQHCHVDAGPDRREIMTRQTLEQCLAVVRAEQIPVVDLTGGAPEMNPHFRWFVTELRRAGVKVIDRCNLTILLAPGFEDLPEFLAEHAVSIVASLPCYLEENCDRQRGDGVFQKSIEALQRLNEIGYGRDPELELTLVYNPGGPALPPDQSQLEAAYREQLRSRFGIEFTRLITITNMPISRFLEDLLNSGRYAEYMNRLIAAFNPAAVEGLMCRNTLSVDWQGNLYDCDFNQMLGLTVVPTVSRGIGDFDSGALSRRPIVTGRHCFGCTAGAGSGCQGATIQT
ncbi:MAG: arsenosugar biosynthesis radical SAM protein ArsS, partial [Planctomycetaceae bacterium]|nr:arsenosugar biosynthesis radical SAM protein ArsS [Planctomycetaceae bacterium]